MAFVGPYQLYKIDSDTSVSRVSDWDKSATAVTTALGQIDGRITNLGPAWAKQNILPAGTNLNTYKVTGIHRMSSVDATSFLNAPPGLRSAAILENLTTDASNTWWVQRITEHSEGARTWWRASVGTGGDWGPWSLGAGPSTPVTEWHVFVLAGQSNMQGAATVTSIQGSRFVHPKIAQFGYVNRVVETAPAYLQHNVQANGMSPGTFFALKYLESQLPHVGVLLVPSARGGTGFTNSTTTHTWTPNVATNPAYDLPKLSVQQAKDAVAAAKVNGAVASLRGVLWHQGEANSSFSTTGYANALSNLIAYYRTELAAPKLPFLVGQMTPESIVTVPGRAGIDAAHQQMAAVASFTAFAPSTAGGHNEGDTTHMNLAGVQFLGSTYGEAYFRAQVNVGAARLEGSGSPEGAALARIGSEYTNVAGAPGSIRYVKTTAGGNTGWSAIW